MTLTHQQQQARANAMCWACWPHDCPRFVLSSSGLVSFAAEWLEWVDGL